jgi:hypothetical protein
MKKRVVSWLLVVLMLTSLLPTSVLAEMAEGAAQTPAAEEVLPETPEVPESPESPGTPEEPAQPETPEQPEQPEQPEGEEQTSAPQLAPQSAAIAVQALSGSGKADDPYRIGTAEDLQALGNKTITGCYKLTADIDMAGKAMTPIKKFSSGTFDGDWHTISGLTISVSSGSAGLFAETGSSAVIKNLTVDADVTSSFASASNGTAGLIGKATGTTTVENCGVTGTVSNTVTNSSSATYVGGLIGYLAGDCTVTNSYSQATVSNTNSASSSSTGGFLGKTSNYYTLTVKNCYSSGDVTAKKGYAGGFTGYVYCSSNYKHIYENCYAAGTVQVTGASSNACGFAYNYASSGYTFTNCYYNSSNAKGCNKSDAAITGKTTADLKDLADTLGDAFVAAPQGLNSGYPILNWQYVDPTATPTVTVTVVPADAKLVWDGEVQTGGENGVYTLENQKQGPHTYSVTNEAGDYASKNGEITVKASDMRQTISLERNTYTLKFDKVPDDGTLTVKDSDGKAVNGSNGVYTVISGTYTYTVTGAFGFEDKTDGSVEVMKGSGTVTETVQMVKKAAATVKFRYAADAEPTITVVYAKTQWNKVPMAAEADGSYLLPVGYAYDWTFESDSYITQTGTVDLTKVAADATETVDVTMSKKPAGTGDAAAPYQITDASQLRWFAQQVNDGRSSICAVLTKDIDLGDEPWTPIGQYARNAYTGTFDGQRYTIKVKITGSTSNHYGLFGVVGSGTVRNLTVEGTVTVTGSSSSYGSSYGIAGIVGAMNDGTTGTVENCVNKATISGTQNVGGIVGYISGGYTAGKRVIQNCANYGDISSTSNDAGGIVGNVYGAVTIQNCYNRGTISGGNWRAGGIVSFLNSSYGKVLNCYTIGKATAKRGDFAQVVGKKSSGTITNCYYLSTLGTDSNATAVTETELKAVPKGLGDAFVAAPTGLKDGYPVLRWQIPTYAVTFTVAPADAVVTIDGQTGTHTGGQWVFKLPDGTYTYTVSAFGYVQQSDTVTVSSKALAKDVTLTAAAKRTVTFTVTPAEANAAITVTWNGQTVQPESDGSYRLPEGAYSYTVKAKGYAKVVEPLNVVKDETIRVTLTPSTAWDGAEKEQPGGSGTQTDPYQIGSGEQLAWLADKVNNASSVTKLYVELTDDIDLGKNPWTPIGKDSHEFTGCFDGQGHTVSGLNATAQYAGLFGVIKNAEIAGVVVQGTVTSNNASSGDAGGIVGRATGTKNTITDCGNEATVSGGSYCGGILGNSQNWNTEVAISDCYNAGSVKATDRAAGIVARYNASNPSISDCYNTGNIASETYAAGIFGGSSTKISKCYNTGTIKGIGLDKTGAITTINTNGLKTCYYLESSIPDGALTSGATPISDANGLLDKLGTDNWKAVRGVNNGYPVLAWQTDETPATAVTMAKNIRFAREEFDTDDGDVTSLPTGLLLWNAAEGRTYTVTLWQMVRSWTPLDADGLAEYNAIDGTDTGFPSLEKLEYVDTTAVIGRMSEEQRTQLAKLDAAVEAAENDPKDVTGLGLYQAMERRAAFIVGLAKAEDLGAYESQLTFVEDIAHVSGGEYDLSERFAARGDGVYYASVAEETVGQTVCCNVQTAERRIVGYQEPYNRMTAVTGLHWDGTTAKWNGRENFSGAYRIDLYTVTGEGTDAVYTHFKTFALSGNYTSANFANAFAAGKKYAFTVTAIGDQSLLEELGLTDSITSAYSDIYDPSAGTEDPSTKQWVDIHSAAEWIELANVEDEPTGGTDSPSKQQVEWGKNYRLANDIDFSTLTAEQQTKTKSIGTVTYPFMGEFSGKDKDGNQHKITGLTLSNSDSGLFWYTGATAYIHDLTIEGANVLFSDNAAVLAHNNYGRIEKCAVVNTNITADTGAVLGGMVSRNYGVIRSSYVQGGTLTSNTTTSVGHAGFVGANESGGLIERCWTSMDVSTQSMHAAGFVGLGYGGTIRNCFALGNVSARGYSGGFVGRSVYNGNTYENCYAAGVVTVTGAEGNGFIGGNQDWSSFQYDQSEGIKNCYYNSTTASSNDYGAVGKSLDEMKTDGFLTAISGSGSGSGVWAQEADKNGGLPYLLGVAVPETAVTAQITVKLAIATYDKSTYSFQRMGDKDKIEVTLDSTGNTRVVDVLDAAQAQGLLTYAYATTSTYGRFIHTINGYAVDAPDGWMFTINDKLSNVSASLAAVKDGDQLLWFEGTTENHFQGPSWEELTGTPAAISWVDIETVNDLLALAKATDAEILGRNYRLKADLDLKDTPFGGIGSTVQPFTGMFDGQGHTISHMTINAPEGENVGFFNVIKGATIRDLKLVDVKITGKTNVGGLAGSAQVQLDSNDLSKNVANLIGGCSVSGTVTGTKNVGGLVGLNEGKTDPKTLFSIASAVDKCAASVTVNGKEMTGGLVGKNGGTITKSFSGGTVKGDTTTGGLVGDSSGDIYDSHTSCTVTGSSHTGGFVGFSDGTVKNCYSIGGVSGTDCTGGFAGVISRAENVVSAGQVTIVGTPTQGYNGGFAGKLYGMVAGLDNQITVKNASGNCTQPNGPDLPVVGNAIDFSGDAQKEALEKMALRSDAEVNAALKKLFPDPVKVMDTIAAALAETKDGWSAMDMTAYAALGSAKAQLSDAARQNVINLLIAEANTATASTSDRSRIELVLRALGADTTRLYPVNSNTPVDNAAKLRAADMSAVAYYTAPYVLLANMQGNVKLTSAQIDALITVLENAQRDGMLGGEYGGQFYSDPDSTGAALAALAGCGNNSRARALLETLKEGLRKHVASAAYSSNANTDAMIITGLVAAGVDPETVICADGSSIVTDLLRYVNDTKDGFLYGGVKDRLATEQGFRALIALAQFQATGKAFNIYDFSAVKTQPSHATGTGVTETPEQPPETEDKITVTVTISTPGGTWLSKSVKLNKGSTVYHAFIAALEGSGISQVGAANGYVRSMTKDGVTYGEFTSGPNSGWLYKVNGRLPSVPLTQKAVNNGDYVLWYYTTDWKADPDAGKMADEEVTAADVIKLIDAIGTVTKNSGNAIAAARSAYNKLPADQRALVTNYDKLVAAEAAYAELVKALQEDNGRTNETTGAWQQPYQKALDGVKGDELAFGSEWLVIALARSGREVPDSYYDSVVKAVQDAGGVLSDRKFTEYSRTILALTAIGRDPTNVGGYDLLARLADMDDVTFQGLNGAIFALIALDSNKYDVPAVADGGKQVTRDGLVAYILDQQLSDGGWALSGDSADPDMTAMALQALAAYRTGDKAVQSAVDKALKTLSDMQQADGGYSSWGTLNSESCAQVIIALTALGIDPAKDSRFAKNGLTVLDALLSFALDGGFRHTADGERNDMATEQALCALTAYARLLDGKTALYDMTDVLGGQTPDVPDDVTPDETPKKGVGVAVWIVLGAAAVGGCTALVLTRRRRDE